MASTFSTSSIDLELSDSKAFKFSFSKLLSAAAIDIFWSVSMTAKVWPTSTTASVSNFFSSKTPLTSLGTSLSTLSVEISTTDSSTSTRSPTSFNQVFIVASATLSPILGSLSSNFAIIAIYDGDNSHCKTNEKCGYNQLFKRMLETQIYRKQQLLHAVLKYHFPHNSRCFWAKT